MSMSAQIVFLATTILTVVVRVAIALTIDQPAARPASEANERSESDA